MKFTEALDDKAFKLIGSHADKLGLRAFVVGGFVRDFFLGRSSKDIDIVVVGSGIDLARSVGAHLRTNVSVFKTFGTAMLRMGDQEIEFVGARKESYSPDSRKPHVEDGTIEDDQLRRDFTINAMAFSINADTFGELFDPFDGRGDLERCLIKTPCDPDVTFSDDPLRMIRAVRFASRFGFDIVDETFEAIKRNKHRMEIVSKERVTDELNKIMASEVPSMGFMLFDSCELLDIIFPEVAALKGVEVRNGRAHKDNFLHTLKVLDNVALKSDNLWLRWAALLHDIAKPRTKSFDARVGWSFHSHETVGSKMIPTIFSRMRLPMNDKMKYVRKLVFLHLRPIALVEDVVTDSAVRRLLFEAGDDIDDLMILCKADITSSIEAKVKRYMANFELVKVKMKEIEEKDRVRNFQPPITGDIIMETYGIEPCREVGLIKEVIKDAILEGTIANDYDEAYAMMERLASEYGFVKVSK